MSTTSPPFIHVAKKPQSNIHHLQDDHLITAAIGRKKDVRLLGRACRMVAVGVSFVVQLHLGQESAETCLMEIRSTILHMFDVAHTHC